MATVNRSQTKQRSNGIQQCQMNVRTSPMKMQKITLSVGCNKWLKRLDAKLNITIKIKKANELETIIVKLLVINSPKSPPSLRRCKA